MILPFILAVSGVMGAAGVILAAAGAHAAPAAGLGSASQMLLFHAVAVLAAAALHGGRHLWQPAAVVAMAGWIVGAMLFSGDIALRAFAGHRLFPMAAPSGGVILIASWLAIAVAAIGVRR